MQKTLYIRLLCVSVFLSVRESVLLCVKKLKYNLFILYLQAHWTIKTIQNINLSNNKHIKQVKHTQIPKYLYN